MTTYILGKGTADPTLATSVLQDYLKNRMAQDTTEDFVALIADEDSWLTPIANSLGFTIRPDTPNFSPMDTVISPIDADGLEDILRAGVICLDIGDGLIPLELGEDPEVEEVVDIPVLDDPPVENPPPKKQPRKEKKIPPPAKKTPSPKSEPTVSEAPAEETSTVSKQENPPQGNTTPLVVLPRPEQKKPIVLTHHTPVYSSNASRAQEEKVSEESEYAHLLLLVQDLLQQHPEMSVLYDILWKLKGK